jgi:hypothetical protein
MKNIFKILFLTLSVNLAFSQAPTSGLVAFYPFNNNSNDESGNSRNGISSNVTYTIDRFGLSNKSAVFNATNSSITISSWSILNNNSTRTISLWFKAVGQTTSQYMLSWGTNATNQSSVVGNYYGSGSSAFGFQGYSTGITQGFSGICPYFDNQWHSVIFTHDGTTSKLFVDGVQKTSGANTFATGSSNLFIGNYFGSSAFFNGGIDDIRIYNRALSTTEVTQLYTAELPISSNDLINLGVTKFLHTSGTDNLSLGENSGISISTGSSNILIGKNSGKSNTSGTNNIIIGHDAGFSNTIGYHNIFLGKEAGKKNTIGQRNTFVGFYSGGENTTQNYNSYFGDGAGTFSIGEKNTFIGWNAGQNNTTGRENTFVGALARGKTNLIKRSSAIGYNAIVGIDDAIVLGDTTNPNIKVGIGIASPKYRLDVKGVVNMNVGFNSPALKINDKDFIILDNNGTFVLSTFKLKYENQWSDDVFESNYQLKTINEIIDFTKKYKHLPNIPSAKDVVEYGVDVNLFLPKLLEKIEELTLYVYQINEENKKLKIELEKLKR